MTLTPRDAVVEFTFESWTDAVERGMARPPERLALTMMRHPAVRRLLVADPPRNAIRRVAKRMLGRREAAFPSDERHRIARPLTLRAVDPTTIDGLERQNAEYDYVLARAAARMGMRDPVAITASPFSAGYAPHAWCAARSYYARDDWTELPARRPWVPALREAYRRIRASGMPVLAVSQAILERIDPRGPGVVVPNGVDPGEWAGPPPDEPAALAGIPHPRAVYVGTLDSRLDVDGVAALAARRPDLHIVLIGPQGEPEHLAPLRGLPTVHVLPPAGRAQLVAAIRTSDVCLVAHTRTTLTAAMSPLKIYEYLAGGAPVLSVDLPPVRGIDDRVLLTDSVADFSDRVDEALALGPAAERDRLGFVAANSWASRHERILETAYGAAS
jgi:hypothetical protein